MGSKQIVQHAGFDSFVLESYGVRVRITASDAGLLADAEQMARRALVGYMSIVETDDAEHSFGVTLGSDGRIYLTHDGEQVSYDRSRERFFKFFDSLLRIVIAEHALDRVFIHAGVVGWKGKAIIIPANSFRGKTTLVTALVMAGAEYYSDEYAVLDENGLVHPFPREMSVRFTENGTVKEKNVAVESLGGRIGTEPIPVGMLLLAEYDEDAVWNPQALTPGQGIIEVIPHTIPRNFNPAFSLKVLNTAISDAIILKSPRGEAVETATELLSFFDNSAVIAEIT